MSSKSRFSSKSGPDKPGLYNTQFWPQALLLYLCSLTALRCFPYRMPPGPGGAPTDQVTSVGSETGVNTMLTDLEEHIYASGIADMVESADVITQDSEKYVERLLTLFRRFSAIVAEAFSDDPRYLPNLAGHDLFERP